MDACACLHDNRIHIQKIARGDLSFVASVPSPTFRLVSWGVWVCGVWCVVCGVWCVVCGVWCVGVWVCGCVGDEPSCDHTPTGQQHEVHQLPDSLLCVE